MDINDLVQQRIAEATRRREATKQRRAQFQAARDAGLARRHATKLRHLVATEARPDRANGTADCGLKGCGPQPPAAA